MADPRLDLLHAMRQKGNETQLSRAIRPRGDPEAPAVDDLHRSGTCSDGPTKAKFDAALKRLEANGFSEQNDGEHVGWYAVHDRVAPTHTAATPDAALWEQLEGRLNAIVASGTLDSLVS